MSAHQRFHLRTLSLLRAELSALGLDLPLDDDFSILGQSVAVGGRVLPNRFAVQPMEGFDSTADGSPDELSFRRYGRYAEGGAGLIWYEATAVLHEARSNLHQLWLHRGNVDQYARLVESTRAAARQAWNRDVLLVVQLTHSGRYSKPEGFPRPLIAHRSPILDPLHKLPADYPVVTDEYLDRLLDVYVDAAQCAAQAGFDGVDLKSCHRYLVSELLASFTREGRYGGPLENRARLLLESVARIKQAVPGIFVTTRLNVYDAIPYPYGFGVDREDFRRPDLAEPLEVVRRLRQLGLPLLNVTIGNPYYNPHFGRPYDWPVVGAQPPEEHPLEAVVRFLGITRQVQQAFPDLPVVGSGYSWLRHLLPYAAAGAVRTGGATLVGQGRGAFAYPDSPRDILELGRMDPQRACVSCSGCTQIMRDGAYTGCVIRDAEIYGPSYQLARRFAPDRLREQARRCRDCEFPTCTAGCPARVDVPAFVRAFADDRIADSYAVLRRSNALPEMCARVCPAEVQCEGGCIDRILVEHALPIRDIQLAVCQAARRQDLAGVSLPETASGARVAVVGGGPAGLAGAIRLLELGHSVTIFDRAERLGGVPESMIPAERCASDAAEIDAILAPALAAGRAELRLGCTLGANLTLAELRPQFDAVLLALGLGGSTSLGQADGVLDALAFLADVKQGRIARVPARVAVLGAGNTAMDAAAAAQRLGAADVFLVYRRSFAEMPAWPNERDQVLRAGVHLLILTQPLGYQSDAHGKLTALRIARTELGQPDASGRRAPRVVPNSESLLDVDLAIEALGQGIPGEVRGALPGLEWTRHGLLATQPGRAATALPDVFAAGDLVNGGTTAVQGIAEGMRAAEEISQAIREQAKTGA